MMIRWYIHNIHYDSMINYINKFKQMKEVVKCIEDSGYSIYIHHKDKPILEVGTKKSNYMVKNTVGDVKIHYINTTKLIAKLGIELLRS